jgi:hypothetical protein
MTARTTAEWVGRMRDVLVLAVAAELGRESQVARGASGGSVYGCPACGADRRHSKTGDKRGAVGIERDGKGWRCFQCDASGDALHFVAYALHGHRFNELADTGKAAVRDWCCRWLGLDDSSSITPRAKPVSRPVAPPKARAEPEPVYPPAGEVTRFWGSCVRVDAVPEVRNWLDSKRIDAGVVADRDLARAIPNGLRLPEWAAIRGVPWGQGGYRLVAPIVDALGAVRSIRARQVFGGSPKSLAPSGYQSARLLFACGLARQVLATGKVPEWWTDQALRFEIAEGEKKWLMRATLASDANEYAPACIAVESGSWQPEHAARIPDGASVFIATDPDETGARYATTIVQSLAPRIISKAVRVELRAEHTLHVADGSIAVKVRS